MKCSLLIILFLINVNCSTRGMVYVCNSDTAKKYHYKSNCRGLGNCQYKIIQVSLDKAEKDGKTLCGWEK
ncbi:5-bromo-4-chloroindolyl phosphate hydrolysis protein [Pedobacter cryoconitis]|uniref:5-bromo-4-chloroindolyl phosphate hydrolysis protein n=1 Tax=Pedobacter cryoconitis TaxID=188932 RepID=A0A7X0MHP9_9SPHI|nr:5-bromo-4-chloroindolyl phosphate hydrolysis protein [Pedobacter cryoconitis]